MDARFIIHNTHHRDLQLFSEQDPHLKNLFSLPYTHESALIKALPVNEPGIYTLSGGRQVGKTTLLKQWMLHLLKNNIDKKSIFFFTGEIINDHHNLITIMQNIYATDPDQSAYYVIVDEVTYIKDWDKAVKFLADSGQLHHTILMLSGSDRVFIKDAMMRFPGRRGRADTLDFHLHPLSFREIVDLKHKGCEPSIDLLFKELDQYFYHGGYLTALNEYATKNQLTRGTLRTYSDWIRGDSLKHGKSEHYLREVLSTIVKTYGSQVTWNSLGDHVSIDHPKTIQDYVCMLAEMDALFIQHALREDTLMPYPKKAKKIYFADPFIYHAVSHWVGEQSEPLISIPASLKPLLIETVVVNHVKRAYPTYYIKAEGEVDIAYVKQNHFWPIEIKWTNQVRAKDLKQIKKYKNALIVAKQEDEVKIHDIRTIPVPKFLYSIESYL